MNSLGLAFSLQGGQARLPLSATIDIGPIIGRIDLADPRSLAAGAPP